MYKIGIDFGLSAAHWLNGMKEGHICSNLHGHNYVIIVEAASETLDDVGFVVDYFDLLAVKDWVKANWDHKCLNELVDYNPTVENLARDLYERFKPAIPQLSAITIKETPTTYCTYTEV